MNELSLLKRAQILGMMLQGASIRAISHLTGAGKNTIVKMLSNAGKVCSDYQDRTLVNLPCKSLQAGEVWSFIYPKQKNVPQETRDQFGVADVWTWTALCADTKLGPSWYVGTRDVDAAYRFISDLMRRLAQPVLLSTDGHHACLSAVDAAFAPAIDHAVLIEIYGPAQEAEQRYCPPTSRARSLGSVAIPIASICRSLNLRISACEWAFSASLV